MTATIRPLKKYGQNFLRNEHLAEQIVAALECGSEDTVLEIGAGEGVLTEKLVRSGCRSLIAVEIDKRLAAHLRNTYGPALDVIEADFVTLALPEKEKGRRIKIIGNIPYYLTSDILFKLLGLSAQLERAVLMLQQEVADRLVAGPGSKDYGILTVFTACRATVVQLFSVGRENFYPQPKVDSAVVRLAFTDRLNAQINDQALFREIVYRSFRTRRKMLRNSLKEIITRQGIDEVLSVDLTKRPEELTPEQFIGLSNELGGVLSDKSL
jgi:16S rRNA (adenine1518-N6/adenine1519-N6)-dimethyltransferase